MADIFVSYTSSDRQEAEWIGRALKTLGHTAHLHDWETQGGEDILAWMDKRFGAADFLIAVLSDEYLKACFSRLEFNAAVWQAGSRRLGFLIMVTVKPCEPPPIVAHFRRCELLGLDEEARFQRFRDFMRKPIEPERLDFLARNLAISNIPIRVPAHFTGRDAEVARIAEALRSTADRGAIVVLQGMRGVGKTTLAASFGERQRTRYRAVWWIRAQVEASLCEDLAELGARLGWAEASDKGEGAALAVLDRLQEEDDRYLLIYDNANSEDDIERFLPRSGACRCLITTNSPHWSVADELIQVNHWSADVGAGYLMARTRRKDARAAAAAAELSVALGGLPLAHEQAAAYCDRTGISFAAYLTRYLAEPIRFLDDERSAPKAHNDGVTVARSFALAIEQAQVLHPAARDLIVLSSLLAPDPIPLFLFSEAQSEFDPALAALLSEDSLDEAVAALRGFALVARQPLVDEVAGDEPIEAIEVHRLVQQVAIAGRSHGELDAMRRSLARALSLVYPRADIDRERARKEKRSLLPHVLAAVSFLQDDHGDRMQARDLLDSLMRLVMRTLQDAGARDISPAYLAAVVADTYEVQLLSKTIARLVKEDATWPAIQRQLLDSNNYVLRYAMAEALASSRTTGEICKLIDEARDLNEFELGGYALAFAYARDPAQIDRSNLDRLVNHPAYPGRSIVGDLLLNLALCGASGSSGLRTILPNPRFWDSCWDFIRVDVDMIAAAEAFVAAPDGPPAGLSPAAAQEYAALWSADAGRQRLLARHPPDSLIHRFAAGYARLGEDSKQIEEAASELASVLEIDLEDFMRVMFAHPVWSVAEQAATSLSNLIEAERSEQRLAILARLLDDKNWRVQFGANECAFAIRHHAPDVFRAAVARFYNHWNCKIRGLCAENLIADILNSGAARRDELLREHERELKYWLRDEDCWVLEHVFRLFSTFRKRAIDISWLASDGVSRLFDDAPDCFSWDREQFLRHIEMRKTALSV